MPEKYMDTVVTDLSAEELVSRINWRLARYSWVKLFRNSQRQLILRSPKSKPGTGAGKTSGNS